MLSMYLRSTIRSIQHNLQSATINLVGLSLGMTVFILIAQFVRLEYAYDASHDKHGRLYRLIFVKGDDYSTFLSPGAAPLFASQVTGVASYCRIAESQNIGSGIIRLENGESFREQKFAYVDGTFFHHFSFPVSEGDANGLAKPYAVAISRNAAARLFNTGDAIGKRIKLNNQFGETEYAVVAVFDHDTEKTNLNYDLLFSLETLNNPANLNGNEGWASLNGVQSRWLNCFVLTAQGSDVTSLNQKMSDVIRKANPGEADASLALQAIEDMNLGRSIDDPHPTYSSLATVYAMIVVAILILSIALFNYVNLTTAEALKRTKEVGLRKISGASQLQLVALFMFQSLVYCFVSLLISLAIVNLVQQPVNSIIGKELDLSLLLSSNFGLVALAVFTFFCVMAGAYVGFSLSSFQPISILRGSFIRSQRGTIIRKGLIVFQFSVTAVLVTLTVVHFQQSQYMLQKELGMEIAQLVTVKGPEVGDKSALPDALKRFENEMASLSFVDDITRSGNTPFRGYNFSTSGFAIRNMYAGSEDVNFHILMTDHRFHSTYSINLSAGRAFNEADCLPQWNDKRVVMINSTAAHSLGLGQPSDAVGKILTWGQRELEIVGVVEDYHHLPVQSIITPLIFVPAESGDFLTFKVEPGKTGAFMEALVAVFNKNFPGNPLEFNFLTESAKTAYKKEQNYTILSATVSLLAIVIALLGILGLITFMIEQRIKEVGIRRIVGASTLEITVLFSKEFIRLILLSAVVAIPVSVILAQNWLEGFAYRVDLVWFLYLIGPASGVVLALLIVIRKVRLSAGVEAVNLLRHE